MRKRVRVLHLLLILLFFASSACSPADPPEGDTRPVAPTADPGLSSLETALAIEAIQQLKARYFRYLDTKDWPGIASLFTDDAEAVYNVVDRAGLGTLSEPVLGPNAIAAFIRNGVEPLVTVHHGHMPEIELTSATTARGIWAMEDILQRPEDGVDVVHGFGHYHETYARIDGQWRIKTLRLTRLRVDRK